MPTAAGVKLTLMLQLAPAAKLAPQLLVVPKSPVTPIVLINNAAVPLLVRVTDCAVLVVPIGCAVAKVTAGGARTALGAVTPVPVSGIACGLLPALSTKVSEPKAPPAAVGLKVTLMVQILPAATGEPQVLVWAKGAVAVMEPIFSVAVPELVTVTVWAALVRFTI